MNIRCLIFLIATMTMQLVSGVVAAQEEKKEPQEKVAANQEGSKKDAVKPVGKQESKQENKAVDAKQQESCVLANIEMKDICGQSVKLKKYEGKVVLIVNVASKCGYTGQYKPLQALHNEFNKHGLEIVAFPCNQFGKQEPAKEEAISKFCKNKFGIEFDMFAKVDVKGDKQVELFKQLTKCELAPAGTGEIKWNFEKFLIGKDGKPIARFRSNVSPDDEVIVSKVRNALGIENLKKAKDVKSVEKDAEKAKDKKTEDAKQDKKS
jgi:glutathione peroxidase